MATTQPTTANAKQSEICTLVVNSQKFTDWDTIWIQVRWNNPFPVFRFTCAERDPLPLKWDRLQFLPGDICDVWLGGDEKSGQQAIHGVILNRQVAYDANAHGVSLQGVGLTFFAARASIVDKSTNYDGMPLKQIVDKVLAPTGIKALVVGTIDPTKFKQVSASPGEPIYPFIEKLARDRKVLIGSDHLGNFLLIGDHKARMLGALVEGVNILSCQAVWTNELYTHYIARGQTKGDDGQYGQSASEIESWIASKRWRVRGVTSPLVTAVEHPVSTQHEIDLRAEFESIFTEGDSFEVTVTVQGWFSAEGELWRAGGLVSVHSPMAVLNHEVLGIDTVTYTQDERGGTRTTLLCKLPWRTMGGSEFIGPRAEQQPPPAARQGPDPTQDPAAPSSGW